MLGKRGPTSSSLWPVSGLTPSMLMWSAIAISEPGGDSTRSDPAALVTSSASAPACLSARTGARPGVLGRGPGGALRAGTPPLEVVFAPLKDRAGPPPGGPKTGPPAVAGDPGLREAGQVAVVDLDRVLGGVGEPAEARAEDQP